MRKLYQKGDYNEALKSLNNLKFPLKKNLQPIPEIYHNKLSVQYQDCPWCKQRQPSINFYEGASELNNMWILHAFVLDSGPYKGNIICKSCYEKYLSLLEKRIQEL